MPTGVGEVVPYLNPAARAKSIAKELKQKEWFGFGEVDIEVPQVLWGTFAEMPPFFYNKEVPVEAVPQHMQNYLKRTERARSEFSEPIGALSAKTFLDYAPLLEWYLDHGAVLTKVHRTINYVEGKPFVWFVDEVTAARRMGDADKSKALLAEIFKLLGNSAPGKMIENLESKPARRGDKQEHKERVLFRHTKSRRSILDRVPQNKNSGHEAIPGGHRGLPVSQKENARILLRFLVPVLQPQRLRAHPNGHRQLLHGHHGENVGQLGQARAEK